MLIRPGRRTTEGDNDDAGQLCQALPVLGGRRHPPGLALQPPSAVKHKACRGLGREAVRRQIQPSIPFGLRQQVRNQGLVAVATLRDDVAAKPVALVDDLESVPRLGKMAEEPPHLGVQDAAEPIGDRALARCGRCGRAQSHTIKALGHGAKHFFLVAEVVIEPGARNAGLACDLFERCAPIAVVAEDRLRGIEDVVVPPVFLMLRLRHRFPALTFRHLAH